MATESIEEALRHAMDALDRTGLLFLHDARKPSLTALVAGALLANTHGGHPNQSLRYHLQSVADACAMLASSFMAGSSIGLSSE